MMEKLSMTKLAVQASQYQQQGNNWKEKFALDSTTSAFPEMAIASEAGHAIFKMQFSEEAKSLFLKAVQGSKNKALVYCISAMSILMRRYGSENNVVLNVGIDSEFSEGKNATLPVILTINDDSSFRDILVAGRNSLQFSLDNKDYPMSYLADELNKSGVIANENFSSVTIAVDSHRMAESQSAAIVSEHGQHWEFIFDETQLACEISYSSSYYCNKFIAQLANHFEFYMAQLLTNLSVGWNDVDCLSHEEKSYLTDIFNDTVTEYGSNKTIASVFEEVAEQCPETIAIKYHGDSLTYAELNRKACQLARKLSEDHSIAAGDCVAVYLDRSIDVFISYLAALKCNAAYVPIDVDLPAQRREYLFAKLNSKVLITNSKYMFDIDGHDGDIFIYDLQFETLPSAEGNSQTSGDSNNLAYVMFTSGTTGTPKGVLVNNKAVVRLVKNTNYIDMQAPPIILQASSLAFDGSTFEIWGALLNGGTLILEDKENILNINHLKSILFDEEITHMWFTCSWFNQLVDQDIDIFSRLHQCFVGGEALSARHVHLVKEKYGNLILCNAYGPTENTTFSTCHNISCQDVKVIPLGKPISNSNVYVVNKNMSLQPLGVYGEILVGGDGLSLGYFDNEDETNKKFINFDKISKANNRVYRTGDLGRITSDGLIEYAGRLDNQIKLRGFRIELGEIESCLLQLAAVREARVFAMGSYDDKYLCAYVVGDAQIAEANVKKHLAEQLPAYMVPQYIVALEAFPLNLNGKVDIARLPLPQVAENVSVIDDKASNSEKYIQKLWAELLNIDEDKIGLDSDFFQLGGHSLKATLFIAQVHKDLHIIITLNNIFQSPTLQALAAIIDGSQVDCYVPIERVQDCKYYPVSSAQKRMYILQHIQPDSTTYNIPLSFHWLGPLSQSKLQQSLDALVKRHESLRTSFEMQEGEVVQCINENFNAAITFSKDLESDVEAIVRSKVHSFSLTSSSLFSVNVVERGENLHLVIVNIHHIIFDAVSMNIFIKEWSQLYNSQDLEPIPLRYVDYSEWQSSDAGQNAISRSREYWQKRYADELVSLKLPLDYRRPEIQTFNGNTKVFSIADATLIKLHKLANENNATLFMAMLACVNVWLHKLTGQTDLVIGSPVAGRTNSEMSNVIGMFVNTLALRNQVNPDQTFVEFLRNLRNSTAEAFDNQAYPFESLVEDVVKSKDLSRNPIFDVMFALQNAELSWDSFGEAKIQPCYYDTKTSKFDLNIAAFEEDGTLGVSFEYNTALFSENKIDNLIESLITIVDSVVISPAQLIAEIEPLSDKQKHYLLKKHSENIVPFKKDLSICNSVDDIARASPESVAVKYGSKSISYAELSRESNRIANALIAHGDMRNLVVAIAMERSIALVTAIVAVHKAGAGFLMVDPSLPKDRIEYMIENSGASIILSNGLNTALPVSTNLTILNIEHIDNASEKQVQAEHHAHDLAYLIYTSGSTGKPKGVRISYGALANFAQGMAQAYVGGFSENDVFLSNSKTVFDASIAELVIPLYYGASLTINPTEDVLNVEKIAELIVADGVTFGYFPLALIKSIFDELDISGKEIKLNKIFFGAEPIKDTILTLCRSINPDMQIINAYGPTEGAVCTTLYNCQKHTVCGEYLPIGKVMPNINIYVVNENLQLVTEGTVGELLIGGDSLALGYVNDSDTAEKFFLWNKSPDSRVYRTGDLVKWDANGNLIFIGRKDSQIKLRGIRIEPVEIEIALGDYEKIEEVVVQLRVINEEPVLVAYYKSRQAIDPALLRQWCKKKIPAYMLPDRFVHLNNPPVTASGKIDRKNLPLPEVQFFEEFKKPESKTEYQLLAIWSEVLGIEEALIGVNNTFFDLGGNSMKIINLLKKINAQFQSNLKVIDLFQYSTVAELAGHIASLSGEENTLVIEDLSF